MRGKLYSPQCFSHNAICWLGTLEIVPVHKYFSVSDLTGFKNLSGLSHLLNKRFKTQTKLLKQFCVAK